MTIKITRRSNKDRYEKPSKSIKHMQSAIDPDNEPRRCKTCLKVISTVESCDRLECPRMYDGLEI